MVFILRRYWYASLVCFLKLGDAPNSFDAFGIDRAGKPTLDAVEVRSSGETPHVIGIGSTCAFGVFHPKSVILDSDGLKNQLPA